MLTVGLLFEQVWLESLTVLISGHIIFYFREATGGETFVRCERSKFYGPNHCVPIYPTTHTHIG